MEREIASLFGRQAGKNVIPIMSLTESIVTLATSIISSTGYVGVGMLMVLESMVAPVPSEAVMPFAGFLVAQGNFSFLGVVLASTAGSIIGSVLSYWIGRYLGRAFVDRFGKYVFLNHHHLDLTEQFFAKYGEKTVFISRFIPVVRHLISIPAGVGEMHMKKFLLYTAVGAGLWNAFLAYLGLQLGERWTLLKEYGHILDYVVLGLLAFGIACLLWRKRRRSRTA